MVEFAPSLGISETDAGVRLELEAITSAHGATLQDAADELVRKLLEIVMAVRIDGVCGGPELRVAPALLRYLWKLGAVAAAGGDLRDVIFGTIDVS
jgi:hypothetical protein